MFTAADPKKIISLRRLLEQTQPEISKVADQDLPAAVKEYLTRGLRDYKQEISVLTLAKELAFPNAMELIDLAFDAMYHNLTLAHRETFRGIIIWSDLPEYLGQVLTFTEEAVKLQHSHIAANLEKYYRVQLSLYQTPPSGTADYLKRLKKALQDDKLLQPGVRNELLEICYEISVNSIRGAFLYGSILREIEKAHFELAEPKPESWCDLRRELDTTTDDKLLPFVDKIRQQNNRWLPPEYSAMLSEMHDELQDYERFRKQSRTRTDAAAANIAPRSAFLTVIQSLSAVGISFGLPMAHQEPAKNCEMRKTQRK